LKNSIYHPQHYPRPDQVKQEELFVLHIQPADSFKCSHLNILIRKQVALSWNGTKHRHS